MRLRLVGRASRPRAQGLPASADCSGSAATGSPAPRARFAAPLAPRLASKRIPAAPNGPAVSPSAGSPATEYRAAAAGPAQADTPLRGTSHQWETAGGDETATSTLADSSLEIQRRAERI